MSTKRNAYEPLHPSSWYATTQVSMPKGTAGTCRGEVSGTAFPVVLDSDGLVWSFNRDTNPDRTFWTPARGWSAEDFTPYPDPDDVAPEWVEQCTHRPKCTVEAHCEALHREQNDGSW